MASVRPGRPTIELECPGCHKKYTKEKYEYDRNIKKGRLNVCSRSCQSVHMNKSDAKRESFQKVERVGDCPDYDGHGNTNSTTFMPKAWPNGTCYLLFRDKSQKHFTNLSQMVQWCNKYAHNGAIFAVSLSEDVLQKVDKMVYLGTIGVSPRRWSSTDAITYPDNKEER